MIVKLAEVKDLVQLNSLMRRSKGYWGYDDNFMDRFISEFGLTTVYLEKGTTFLSLENETIIGFYSFSYNSDNELQLDNFFIDPDMIGRGKGRILWENCIRAALTYGTKQLILWSDPNAEQFYVKMGCIKIGNRQSFLMPDRYPPIMKYSMEEKVIA